MEKYEAQIGGNIKEIRVGLGYSQEKLAKMCAISNSTLSAYENSKKTPNLITIAKIAKALGVSIERLYYGDENISFINAVTDDGRKIVNCIHVLWNLGVINNYDDFNTLGISMKYPDCADKNNYSLDISKYPISISRLIKSLNEYRSRESTYEEPEKYLEMQLQSVATEINNEIEAENERMNQKKKKEENSKNMEKNQDINSNRKGVGVN
ncbi:MAG: helix-turn-helix domain-containing protein [Lachnospiraceae bacterium]|nr:helix-turn-helix domain-containing protein [Lachnospiraceae bacterium]